MAEILILLGGDVQRHFGRRREELIGSRKLNDPDARCHPAQARPGTFFIIAIGSPMQVPDASNLVSESFKESLEAGYEAGKFIQISFLDNLFRLSLSANDMVE